MRKKMLVIPSKLIHNSTHMLGSGDEIMARNWEAHTLEHSDDPAIQRFLALVNNRSKNEMEHWEANPVLIKAMKYYLGQIGIDAVQGVQMGAYQIVDTIKMHRTRIVSELTASKASPELVELFSSDNFQKLLGLLRGHPLQTVQDRAIAVKRLELVRGKQNAEKSVAPGIMVGILKNSPYAHQFQDLAPSAETEHLVYYTLENCRFYQRTKNDVSHEGALPRFVFAYHLNMGREIDFPMKDVAHILSTYRVIHGVATLKDLSFWFNPNIYPDGSPSPYGTDEYRRNIAEYGSARYNENMQIWNPAGFPVG